MWLYGSITVGQKVDLPETTLDDIFVVSNYCEHDNGDNACTLNIGFTLWITKYVACYS